MRSSHSLDRLDVAFDDDRLVADAGLLLPATLADHLGLRELVDEQLDLGREPGAANAGDKLLTLVMSALAGGDCIDDARALAAGVAQGFRERRALILMLGDTSMGMINGYLGAYVGTMPLAGRLADQWGVRRLFLGGLAAFTLGSLLAGLAVIAVTLYKRGTQHVAGAGTAAPPAAPAAPMH